MYNSIRYNNAFLLCYSQKGDIMAKNKNNNYKNKNSVKNQEKNQAKNSVKNSHAQVPDDSPGRSGPGGN